MRFVSGANVLTDDGKTGDAVSGDGTFSTNGITAGAGASVGPRIVRVKAEVTATGGKRQATAVDIQPFTVQ